MTKRLKVLTSYITNCDVFADVGCDHGFVSEFVLKNNLAKTVIATDVSKPSLQKAINLLSNYPNFIAIHCDGFTGVDNQVDQAIISGMGGEEIVKILSSTTIKPNRLILSPQKNTYKVRRYLVENGYKILKDYTINDDKFYDVIVAILGSDKYLEDELVFGRDNLKNKNIDFVNKIKNDIRLKVEILKNPSFSSDAKVLIQNELTKLKEIINEN